MDTEINANKNEFFSLYYQNIRGMSSKSREIYLNVFNNEFDIIVLTETWLTANHLSSEFFNMNYMVYRKDRCHTATGLSRGGGVLIAISTKFKSNLRHLLIDDALIEQLAVSIQIPGLGNLVLCASYIPPVSSAEIYESHAKNVYSLFTDAHSNEYLCMLGDFNLPNVDWSPTDDCGSLLPSNVSTTAERLIVDTAFSFNLAQINNFRNCVNKILDLIFISSELISNVEEAITPLAKIDLFHVPVVMNISSYKFDNIYIKNSKYNYKKGDFVKLNEYLQSIDWDHEIENYSNDLDAIYQKFIELVHVGINHCIPLSHYTHSDHPPWFNKGLLRLKNAKNKAHKIFKSNKDDENIENNYKRLHKEYKFLHSFLYNQYLLKAENNIRNDSKAFWSFINTKRKSSSIPGAMEFEGKFSNSIQDSCELFADYFESLYKSDAIPRSSINPNTYSVTEVSKIQFAKEDIENCLQNLNEDTFYGPDLLCNLLLKKCNFTLSYILTKMFNLSLKLGVFLDAWKFSYIKPLHKSGRKDLIKNYRGVAKLLPLPKCLDCLVASRLRSTLDKYICDEQHGFMTGRSTTTNLLLFKNFVLNAIEQGKQVDVIYTDFVKAFDRVNIEILIDKLSVFGICSPLLDWIKSYLRDRKQCILLDSHTSRIIFVSSGVPQGSHLGPLLFIIFINDVAKIFSFASFLLFADDLKIYAPISQLSDCFRLQEEIDLLVNWCEKNLLELNPIKCKKFSFYRLLQPVVYTFTINGSVIESPDLIIDLGVVFDRKLSPSPHIDYICSKAFKMLGFIKRNSVDFHDPYTLKALYVSLVRSQLEYANIVWNPYTAYHSARIESVQKAFTRYAIRKFNWQNDIPSYNSRCLLLGLQTLDTRRTIAAIMFVRDVFCFRIRSPNVLMLFNIYTPGLSLRTRNFLFIPTHRTVYGQNEPVTFCSRCFNDAYPHIDLSWNRDFFKFTINNLIK